MHVSSGFLLLETLPGREPQVLEALARIPTITHRALLYPAAIALKVEAPDVARVQADLKRIEGVLAARLYRARNT
jgi:hypothetical protein